MQGDLSGAVKIYREAATNWRGSAVVLFSLTNALAEAGRTQEVVQEDNCGRARELDAFRPDRDPLWCLGWIARKVFDSPL